MAIRSYKRLKLSGQTYTVKAGDTLIILAYVAGDWDNAQIRCDTQGLPAYINVPSAGITVNNVTFRDIDASGGGTIDDLTGGVDEGGNENILFPETYSSRYVMAGVGSGICVGIM
jgi:hypothetical protein